MHLFADYHTHTRYSHGQGTIRDNVEAAAAAGLREVAISDHGPANIFGLGVRGVETFITIRDEICRLQPEFPELRIRFAAEANVISTSGELDLPRWLLSELDLLLVGLHLMIRPATMSDGMRLIGFNLAGRFLPRRLSAPIRRTNTLALIRAVDRYDVDLITHPGLHQRVNTRELARACARRNTALEINVRHRGLTSDFIRVAGAEGACFAISSDAHHPREVGVLEAGLRAAVRAGLGPERIINAEGDG